LAAAQRRLRRLVATGGSEAGQAAAAEVAALQREQERLEAEIRETQDAAGPAVLSPATIGTGIAAPGTLFLEYFLGEKRSFLWAVEPGRLEVFELAPRARLEEAARRVHTLLASADRTLAAAPAEAALSELATLLLAPVADRLAGRRLLIVPDGALAYVPFAALPLPEALVATNEIAVLPSASILAALRRRAGRPSAPQTLAVLADPVFEADDARIPGGGAAAPPRTTTRGTLSDAALPRLPFSQDEAEALLALVPPERRLAALGFAAQRTLVSGGTLARYRLLHFATHAVIDPEHPALSALVLSRISPEGRPQEGFLRAADIARLHLPADLVVLSACRTALGKEVRGEGLMGLTQSFFQAGARRVVVSLWPVDDRATAELMARFYRAMLTSGSTPAAALRAAQASLRREPAWRSPAFWAGFILQGDV
ncbi:MAG TPA: hypothetical protein DD490_16765, partial [Acidobacteria bacterium]|nr:hypothetical protein [Acidobacteriota bacterium]